MFKKFVSFVKVIAKKIESVIFEDVEVKVEEAVSVEESVQKKPMTITKPIVADKRKNEPVVQTVEKDVTNSEPIVEERVEHDAPPIPPMSWKQFKEYNNQVNGYLNQRVSSVI